MKKFINAFGFMFAVLLVFGFYAVVKTASAEPLMPEESPLVVVQNNNEHHEDENCGENESDENCDQDDQDDEGDCDENQSFKSENHENEGDEDCDDEHETPKTATITATKIVCDSEADLPNWGLGGSPITATTATDWVASHSGCHLKSGWTFEYGNQSTSNPGDSLIGAGGAGFTAFGPTNVNGVATVTVPVAGVTEFHLREVLQAGYIPFAYGETGNTNNVSAEFYCSNDVLNYDNFDFIRNPVKGEKYNCVAWNVLKHVDETPNQCGVLLTTGLPTGYQTNSATYDYVMPSLDLTPGNFADHNWVQVNLNGEGVWDMGGNVSQITLVPSIDHGPFPGENNETLIYYGDSATGPWTLANRVSEDANGPSNWTSDDGAGVWQFAGSHRYVRAISSQTNPTDAAAREVMLSDDTEIDAICANTVVVIPTCPVGQHLVGENECAPNPACSDAVDNDDAEDSLVDSADPACHSDQNVNNADSYHPEYTSETNYQSTTVCSDGLNNDGAEDSLIDSNDPGCQSGPEGAWNPLDTDESNTVVSEDLPQCSDGLNNDGDEFIDSEDPGCHTDGNANNNTYNPSDDNETNDKIERSGGSGSRGNNRSGQVLGAETSCGIYVDKFLRKGYKNNEDAVKKVQKFLNDYTKAGIEEDGIFDDNTEAALKAFQPSHKDKILTPWKINAPTGIFYLTTQTEVNNIMCPTLGLPIPSNLVNFTPAVIN